MINVNDLKPGTTFQEDKEIYSVMDISRNKTARGQMIIKVKVRNLRSKIIKELSYTGGDKVPKAHIEKKEMEYLYEDTEGLVFMDVETYDQLEVPKTSLDWERKFLKENDSVTIVMFESEILGVLLPDKVSLRIVECEPAVKGDTATSASKNAILETGLEIKVPLFISEDEMVVVSTADGKYSGRA